MLPVYLLDTNSISELSKPKVNQNFINHFMNNSRLCALSATVWEELQYGINRLPEGKTKEKLSDWIFSIKDFIEVLPYDRFASQICGELRAACEKIGKSLPVADTQIAATAIANGMILVTHNTDDFKTICENSSLHVEDWFDQL